MSGAHLFAAVGSGNLEETQQLLEDGADVQFANWQGKTVLHHAAARGNADIVSLLLYNGADPNAQTDDGRSVMDMVKDEGIRKVLIDAMELADNSDDDGDYIEGGKSSPSNASSAAGTRKSASGKALPAGDVLAARAKKLGLRKPFSSTDMIVASIFNGFFTALALADASILAYGAAHLNDEGIRTFIFHWTHWKGDQPMIGMLFMCLAPLVLIILPVLFIGDILGPFMTKSSWYRKLTHFVDTGCLCVILYIVFTEVLPVQQSIMESSANSITQDAVDALLHGSLKLLYLNVAKLGLSFVALHASGVETRNRLLKE